MLTLISALVLSAAEVQVVEVESTPARVSTQKVASARSAGKVDPSAPGRIVESISTAHIDAQGNLHLGCETYDSDARVHEESALPVQPK